jgi:DNA polymerase III alpha subunit
MRSYGKHAAGVIVSGVPLTERTPVELRNGVRCIAFDKRFCESMGLIKLDVLGLATLDLLALAKRYIKENRGSTLTSTQSLSMINASLRVWRWVKQLACSSSSLAA